jgi:hypothetical protein
LLQLAGAQGGTMRQWLNNCLGGLGRRLVKKHSSKCHVGPRPREVMRQATIHVCKLPASSSRADCRSSFIPSQY